VGYFRMPAVQFITTVIGAASAVTSADGGRLTRATERDSRCPAAFRASRDDAPMMGRLHRFLFFDGDP
jgi:hypothetical protein